METALWWRRQREGSTGGKSEGTVRVTSVLLLAYTRIATVPFSNHAIAALGLLASSAPILQPCLLCRPVTTIIADYRSGNEDIAECAKLRTALPWLLTHVSLCVTVCAYPSLRSCARVSMESVCFMEPGAPEVRKWADKLEWKAEGGRGDCTRTVQAFRFWANAHGTARAGKRRFWNVLQKVSLYSRDVYFFCLPSFSLSLSRFFQKQQAILAASCFILSFSHGSDGFLCCRYPPRFSKRRISVIPWPTLLPALAHSDDFSTADCRTVTFVALSQ